MALKGGLEDGHWSALFDWNRMVDDAELLAGHQGMVNRVLGFMGWEDDLTDDDGADEEDEEGAEEDVSDDE